MKKIIIVLAIIVVALFLLNFVVSGFIDTSDIDLRQTEAKLRAESNMVFVEQVYRRAFFIENSTRIFNLNLPDNQLLLSVNYILRAGIDVSDLELQQIDGFLVVSYTAPQVFSVVADLESLVEIAGLRYRGLFSRNDIRVSHYMPVINGGIDGMDAVIVNNSVVREELVSIKDIALRGGLEQTVRNNAEWWFTTYLKKLGYNDIIFEVRQ